MDLTPVAVAPVPGWLAFLRCTSVRFTCFYFLAFYGGLAGAGAADPAWLALGVGYWFVHSTVTELLNRLADRTADQVDRPERTALCRQLGYPRLAVTAGVGYPVLFALGAVWIALVPTPAVAALVVVAGFLSVNYSYGLRLGRSRFLSLAILAFPFVGSFMGGWALGHPQLDAAAGDDFLHRAVPVLVVGGLVLASLSGVKDLTDLLGDRIKGYRSGGLWLIRDLAPVVGGAVVSTPFVAVVGLVAGGLLPPRFVALVALLPAALLLTRGSRTAGSEVERMAVREFFYHYWMVFLAVLVVLHVGTATSVLTAVACLVAWRLATRYLHWTDDTSLSWVGTVWSLRRRPPSHPADRVVDVIATEGSGQS